MPVSLARGDRKFLIVICGVMALLFVAFGALSTLQPAPEVALPSSYAAGRGGAKAAYLLLQELHYNVERWESPPQSLDSSDVDPAHTVLILAEPFPMADASERSALHRFVYNGGRVVAIGATAAMLVPEGATLAYEPSTAIWQKVNEAAPSALTRGASAITMSPDARWQMANFSHVEIYKLGINSVVATYYPRRGQVIWWAAPTPLTNDGILEPGNLNFFLNCVGPPGKVRILWDEYYHGVRGSLWSYFSGTPLEWGLVQLGLMMMAVLFAFSRRSGPVRRRVRVSRQSPLEFVDTLGGLYHRGHAASAAVSAEWQRFRFLLIRRLGLPASARVQDLYAGARERLGWKEPGLYETLQKSERAARDGSLTDADALILVQALEGYSDLLGLKTRFREENSAWQKT